ncbi:hypothetical protein CK203_094385 [Vitis vinifera]|uniref:Uncharacterized protein n=1 Tax=Vitis vinifera TaxID=29760 RepID=A0A438CS50_VITVI|nr:hypothetical protein CK203_094385 [Vitis vinifera]
MILQFHPRQLFSHILALSHTFSHFLPPSSNPLNGGEERSSEVPESGSSTPAAKP